MKNFLYIFIFIVGVTGGTATVVQAAQDATVLKDNAPIRAEPADGAKVVDYMQNGEDVRVSSNPVNNFYKVRAKNGQYGWVSRKHLSVEQAPEDEESEEGKPPEPEADRNWVVRVLGGMDFFAPGDLNDVFSFNELNTGYMAGVEGGFAVNKRIMIMVRAEYLFKDVVAKESVTTYLYNLGLRSFPVMAGVDFKILKDTPILLNLGVFAGLAYTSFSAEAVNLQLPNQATISGSALTTMVRANVTRPLGRTFSVFAEVGYRHLKTGALDTSNTASGGQVFRAAGVFKNRYIDLSGFTAAVGVGIHF